MLDTTIPANSAGIFELDISRLLDSPSNPRKHYSDTSLAELADSIKAVGSVLEPLLVRPLEGPGGFHELVFGHRRKRAAKGAAKGKGPAIAYRNPLTEETWTGRGLQPKWLKVALAGGKTLADFSVGAAPNPTVAPAGAWPFPNKKEGTADAGTPSPAARAAKKGKVKPGAATQADLGLESTLAADQGKKNSLTKPAEAGEVCQE